MHGWPKHGEKEKTSTLAAPGCSEQPGCCVEPRQQRWERRRRGADGKPLGVPVNPAGCVKRQRGTPGVSGVPASGITFPRICPRNVNKRGNSVKQKPTVKHKIL